MNNAPIGTLLMDNLPYTVELAVAATVLGVLIGMPLGVVSAIRRGYAIDYGARVFALLGFTVPDFYLGALLLIGLSLNLGLFPINGGGDGGVVDNLIHLVLPAFTLGLIMAAFVSRLTRSTLLEVLGCDYVRTARAKGAREPRVIYRHALRNALLPVATGLGLSILSTLSGSVAIEVIFGRPGLGSMLINGIETRDYPVIQADLIVFSIFVVLVNLVMDLLNVFIDPRIRVT
jgi:peptide/nickel transport system permease protein